MATARRTYGDPCGIARALDVVGERWALLVVRELLLGPKRFTDLRSSLPGVSADVLSQRLRELEGAGIVTRGKLPPPAASRVYQLTPRGRELEPVVLALGRWGSSAPFPAGHGELSEDALVLALKTTFDAGRAGRAGRRGRTLELWLGEQAYELEVTSRKLTARRARALRPEAIIASAPRPLTQLLFGGLELGEAERTEVVRIEGDRQLAVQFLESVSAPSAP
jgi:DNA-binding HxlR family transcriptional regulator